ncbi:MAG: CHAD domain-containing protein [Melioribacteraceae bacterium]|nr:MAG: CHAD domain-containing protein [Melioribacteraceae bacterium]
MARKKKFEISGIFKNQEFCEAGKIILSEKLNEIISLIEVLFKDDGSENIHALRIALRRFRYVFEIFSLCYSKKLFNDVYEKVKYLQDLIGECRDLDVLAPKVELIALEVKSKIPKYFYKKIDEERLKSRQFIKLELIKFIGDKNVNSFLIK